MEPVGAKIEKVEWTKPESFADQGWGGHEAAVIYLDNGTRLVAMRDEEYNGLGAFYRATRSDLKPLRPGEIEGQTIEAIKALTAGMARQIGCEREGGEQYILLSNGDELIIARDEEFNGFGHLSMEHNGKWYDLSNTPRGRQQPESEPEGEDTNYKVGDICAIRNCGIQKLNGLRVQLVEQKRTRFTAIMLDDGGGEKWAKGKRLLVSPNIIRKVSGEATEQPPAPQVPDRFAPNTKVHAPGTICEMRNVSPKYMEGARVKIVSRVRERYIIEYLENRGTRRIGSRGKSAASILYEVA